RKVILNLAVSLDSFIEGPDGEIDWCFTDQDYGMTEFLANIDSILFGRKSYELILNMEKDPFPDQLKCVFSRTLKKVGGKSTLICHSAEQEVKKIINKEGKDIWLSGGSNLICNLINADLVDEMQLVVHPLLLGKGKPLFEEIKVRTYFKRINAKTYSSGLVQLTYCKLLKKNI
ncbi:dihydrofolate reductase family protein, partial [Bacteroidota bacterium]